MRLLQAFIIWALSGLAMADVAVVPKFIYVLHGGVDAVWGQYMFMVRNDNEDETTANFKVALPEETVDWQAQEGFQGIQFSLGEKGGVEFTKAFKPGDNVHTIGFKTPASSGSGKLTLTMPMDVGELSLMTSGDVTVVGEGMVTNKRTSGERYDKYHFYDLKAGDTISVEVQGVHVGRSQFWMYGWVAALVMLLACFGLAYVTRPQQTSEV
ncbi:hypothetical protein [Pseudobacteriovorax antillogorgiicola]|uniref:Uncharacterized protein n=1 Tax=Pseudobacteriovorax antillogorgiicola TaxID=1513793 RepID=A0A1Y6BCG1_9BACT|nr:hypothetical protein [Pseudobacteriovorax antillogorgiicola]TCS58559.1 hypothetical protein EDD56_10272 [Pseudobacteriovorax antillogorgiicola]SME97625.1 hypothetical protein SAMN06296036_102371 [Pseudobacteriovorax antillogorgiicola]